LPLLFFNTTNSSPVIFISDMAKSGGRAIGGGAAENTGLAAPNPTQSIRNIVIKYFFISINYIRAGPYRKCLC
jgi:hypothetical protein